MTDSGEKVTDIDVKLIMSIECDGYSRSWVSFHPWLADIILFCCKKNLKVWSYSGLDLSLKETCPDDTFLQCVEAHPNTSHILSCSSNGIFQVRTENGKCIDNYTTKDEWQWRFDCHKTLPLVALGTNKSLVILALNKPDR